MTSSNRSTGQVWFSRDPSLQKPKTSGKTLVDLPSQNLAQNRQYRDTVTCLPAHSEQRLVKVVKVQVICTRSGSIVILLPHNTPTGIKKRSEIPNEPKMHDDNKTCFCVPNRMPVPKQLCDKR